MTPPYPYEGLKRMRFYYSKVRPPFFIDLTNLAFSGPVRIFGPNFGPIENLEILKITPVVNNNLVA